MPADIIVRVGAALDRSTDAVFSDMEKRARAMHANSAKGALRAGTEEKAIIQSTSAEAERAAAIRVRTERMQYREHSRLNRMMAREQLQTERELALQAAKFNRDRTKSRLSALATEEREERASQQRIAAFAARTERAKTSAARAAAKAQAREAYASAREIDRFATRTSHRATRFFFPRPEGALGYGKRVASDLVRGAGVDMTFGGGVARARERETAGMGLAQQERIATGKTQGGAFWANKSKSVGDELQVDPEQVTQMMREFTGKTGDFDAAAAKAAELASMTLAAGANMGEMGSAAGYVYNQLKGMPDAAERTLDVMRGIVGQTAVGAVEMEEYAKQMGRIAANAKMFQGDVSQNILELSALTQLSIAEGGATSGADAARSIAAFANTTSKGQRISAFKKQGIELFNEGGTQKRPILDIIKDSLIKSKGSIPEMTKMWADTLGQKPIKGLTNAYNEAGGGEKGWEAALAKIKPFMSAQMSKEQEKANVADYQQTLAAKAQDFQNKLDIITEALVNDLLPPLKELAPKVLELAQAFSKAVSWAASNPWTAVMAALTASVARAGFESLGRMMLERVIMGLAGNAGASAAAGALGTAAGGVAGGGARALLGSAVGGMANMSGMAGVVGTGAAAASTVALLAGIGVAAYSATTALLEMADAVEQSNNQERAKDTNAKFFEGTAAISSADSTLGKSEAYQAARKKIITEEEQRSGTTFAGGASPQARAALKGLDDFYAEAVAKTQSERSNAEAIGAKGQLTEAGLAQAIVGAMTGRSMNVYVKNTEDFMTRADGGGDGKGGPPTQNQNRFWD